MYRLAAIGGTAGAAALALCAAALFGRAPHVNNEFVHGGEMPPGRPVRIVGVAGCLSAMCHGGPATDSLTGSFTANTWAGSGSHWLACDPHRRAYEALESPDAAAIMKRLGSKLSATEDSRCLACHVNPSLAVEKLEPHEKLLRKDGVSCEACHGNAGGWLRNHMVPARRDGMTQLSDLKQRAATCTGCHIGAPADPARGVPVRDMNHDMIAAGHPRLNWDFAAYQHQLSRHWREKDARPAAEVEAWSTGRLTHAEAIERLSADRRERSKTDLRTPWPEFADFTCVSCHHDLQKGFAGTGSTPRKQTVWPVENKAVRDLDAALQAVKLDALDWDGAADVFHALSARERMRMKREHRPNYDPAFDQLREKLRQPRGNLQFRLPDDAKPILIALLK